MYVFLISLVSTSLINPISQVDNLACNILYGASTILMSNNSKCGKEIPFSHNYEPNIKSEEQQKEEC